MLNIITNPLPSTVMVGGGAVPIATDFRTSLQVQQMLDSPLSDRDIHWGILLSYFGSPQSRDDSLFTLHARELIEAAMGFARMDEFAEMVKAQRGSRKRTFDWDMDQRRLVADFQREYGLDLTDATCEMHWWRFMALFEGLGDTSRTMTAIGYRAMEISGKLPPEEQKRLRDLKKLYELPPRTKEEALARDAAIWGD